jgi:hypothetical protein
VKVDRALAECLLKIKNLTEFQPLREYLVADLQGIKDSLVTQADDKALRNMQGRAQALTNLIDMIDDAERLVDLSRR